MNGWAWLKNIDKQLELSTKLSAIDLTPHLIFMKLRQLRNELFMKYKIGCII